jgi:hypothetical protein
MMKQHNHILKLGLKKNLSPPKLWLKPKPTKSLLTINTLLLKKLYLFSKKRLNLLKKKKKLNINLMMQLAKLIRTMLHILVIHILLPQKLTRKLD